MGEITQLLELARQGDNDAQSAFFSKIHGELERLAQSHLNKQTPLTLLDPSALVREAYFRIAAQEVLPGYNRNAFLSYASRAMRSVIIDYIRSRNSQRRQCEVVTLTSDLIDQSVTQANIEQLVDALDALERVDVRAYNVVEKRFFGGMDASEIAEVLNISTATVKRDWVRARAFLFHFIQSNGQL